MGIRTAHSGGTAVRCVYGVLLALCVALAVLVHHEISGMTDSPMSATAHAAMPGPAHDAHVLPDGAASSVSDASTHSLGDSGCAMPGMQHCSSASVTTVHLAIPGRSAFDPSADLLRALSGRAPGSVASRAPPDLSVLSQLRI
ncbi:DUF6153 family protein [Streptomyces mirabilis]|uniref:DUF6153 family protein n=1 Tax=Streptomyces TaxID=1883 RepID=UPI0029A462F0|nr:DUF6153 family protein [Streptomyces sp. AK02-04a]MDX3760836.1 DUF6153 family protein [Streptomyces sp. AK02-04a]